MTDKVEAQITDAFMSFNFWLTKQEIEQLERLASTHHTDSAAVVQALVKHALKQLFSENLSG